VKFPYNNYEYFFFFFGKFSHHFGLNKQTYRNVFYLFELGFLGVSLTGIGHNGIERDVQDPRHEHDGPARRAPRVIVEVDGHFGVVVLRVPNRPVR